MTTKTICRGGQGYVSPVLEVLDIKTEGILCASGDVEDGGNGGYLEDNEWGTF